MLDRYLRYNPHRTPVQKDFRLMTPRNYYYPLVITLQAFIFMMLTVVYLSMAAEKH